MRTIKLNEKETARAEVAISSPKVALLKSSEVAAALSVSRTTLSRWTKAGRLTCVRLGPNAVYYEPGAILDFLKRHRKKYLVDANPRV
jgi:excisionase family DNA binding protein